MSPVSSFFGLLQKLVLNFMEISRKDIVNFIRSNKEADCSKFVAQALSCDINELEQCPEFDGFKTFFNYTKYKITEHLKQNQRKYDLCLTKHSAFYLSTFTLNFVPSTVSHSSPESKNLGAPRKSLSSCSDRTLKRRVNEFKSTYSPASCEKLALETFNAKSPKFSKLFDSIVENDICPSKIQESIENSNNSPEQILKLMVNTHMTKNDYQKIRNFAAFNNSDLFPPYYKIDACKQT